MDNDPTRDEQVRRGMVRRAAKFFDMYYEILFPEQPMPQLTDEVKARALPVLVDVMQPRVQQAAHGRAEVIDFAKKLRSDEHNDFALLASGLPPDLLDRLHAVGDFDEGGIVLSIEQMDELDAVVKEWNAWIGRERT